MATSNAMIAERDDAAIAGIQKLRFNPLAARGGRGSSSRRTTAAPSSTSPPPRPQRASATAIPP